MTALSARFCIASSRGSSPSPLSHECEVASRGQLPRIVAPSYMRVRDRKTLLEHTRTFLHLIGSGHVSLWYALLHVTLKGRRVCNRSVIAQHKNPLLVRKTYKPLGKTSVLGRVLVWVLVAFQKGKILFSFKNRTRTQTRTRPQNVALL